MAELRIHLGAHKMAMTHFRASLAESGEELEANKTNLIPLQQSRNSYSRVVKACIRGRITPDEARARFAQFFAEDSEGYDTVLVCDENFLGGFEQTLQTGRLYPEAEQHLDLASQIFDSVDPIFFVSVRSYETFFPAFYCEALRWEKQPHFDGLKENIRKNADWSDLIDRLTSSLGARPTVFEYETYLKSQKKYLATFSGLKTSKITPVPRDQMNGVMSEDAVAVVNATSPVIENTNTYRETVARIADTLPPDKARKGFDPWEKAESDALKSSYSAFTKTLRKL